jgi:plasminogen activator inhibitor 1 RNA-binding protein
LDPNDPDAAETRNSRAEEQEENTKTLEEYLSEKKNGQTFRLNEARKANEGADDGQWKDTVVLEKEEDVFFVGKVKIKIKNKQIKLCIKYFKLYRKLKPS